MADAISTLPHKLIKDLRGKRFGRLMVCEYLRRHNRHTYWLCDCDCGQQTEVTSCNLTSINSPTTSCGCRRVEVTALRSFKHGHARRTAEYSAWAKMKERCGDPNCKDYPGYGGRGITVCAEWVNDFQAFFDHIGPKPSPLFTVDRIDNERGYEPGNVRWASRSEQSYNQRRSVRIEQDGERLTIGMWASRLGISPEAAYSRHYRARSRPAGWKPYRRNTRFVTMNGERMSLMEAADVLGLTHEQASGRWKKGTLVRFAAERGVTLALCR